MVNVGELGSDPGVLSRQKGVLWRVMVVGLQIKVFYLYEAFLKNLKRVRAFAAQEIMINVMVVIN